VETKTCIRCEQEKPLTQFSKRRAEKDGHDYYCKDCQRFKTERLALEREQARTEGRIHLAETKECRDCGKVKPLTDFPTRRDALDGHHWWCLDCKRARERAYGRAYRDRHPEQKRQNARKYVRKDSVRRQRSALTLQGKYGLTPEQFEAKLAAQGGKCPFCPDGAEISTWDVDHDHMCCPGSQTCGKCLRDILCHKHNIGLGYWEDDPDLLRRAAEYIETWRAAIKPDLTKPRPPRVPRKLGNGVSVYLTVEQMNEIRQEHAAGGVTQKVLAQRYGASQATISHVINYGG
jgi:hypothetical protein